MLDNAVHFIFDSDHVDDIQTKLYGFYTTAKGLYTQAPSEDEDISDAWGAWVLVKRDANKVTISQDTIGCFGLFLFRKGEYWALSNSLNHLIDFLKTRYELHLNKDVASAILANSLSTFHNEETIIKEIAWLDRRAQLHIDTSSSELAVCYRKLRERSVPVNTEEGLRLLDAWCDKWTSFISQSVDLWPGTIQVDLSGGFDTRMVFALVLSSGIDLSRVRVHCNVNISEDYRIASRVAQECGFELNRPVDAAQKHAEHPIESYVDRQLSAIYFEKEIYGVSEDAPTVPHIVFSGYGGEAIRCHHRKNHYARLVKNRINRMKRFYPYSKFGAWRFRFESLMKRSWETAQARVGQVEADGAPYELDGEQFYLETRCRSHFGMSTARLCLHNTFRVSPLLDPLLLRLSAPQDGTHPLLACALIYTRYSDKLANFPFDGDRSIPEETLQLARELNERYPRADAQPAAWEEGGASPWQYLHSELSASVDPSTSSGQTETSAGVELQNRTLLASESPRVRKALEAVSGPLAPNWYDPRLSWRHPKENKYAAVAIAKAWEDVHLGADACADFTSFIDACCADVTGR